MTDELVRASVSEDGGAVCRPVFSDDALYAGELRRIFARKWIYLGHESQLKTAGDFVSAFIGETPVIVARAKAGGIVASINSCTHRGLPVCRSDKGHAARFTCPYHNWVYSTEGDLIGVPQDRLLANKVDRSRYGLKRVPRVESFLGMIFGCLDPEIEPLDDYLGDMRFYLEAYFDRFDGGIEVLGAPHKWQLKSNWKLPVENQLGDFAHAPYLHGSMAAPDSDSIRSIEQYGLTMVSPRGHSAAVKLMPEDADPRSYAYGLGDEGTPPELTDYFMALHARAIERVGPVRARIVGLSTGIYPNFSMLIGQSTLRISHPRGPGLIEYWSWPVVPANAPAPIKEFLRSRYNFTFGPGGMLEQEDSLAWSQQFVGASIRDLHNVPLHYGLGEGEEFDHPELPGRAGKCFNEHYARQFYRCWREDMLGMEGA